MNDLSIMKGGESEIKIIKMMMRLKELSLRPPDNGVSSNIYQLLVDQEVGYIATK